MAQQDYYETLGVDRQATPDELKRAYRKLAMKHHPDRTSGDKASEERFKEISEAYAVLSDTSKRQEYDRFGRVKSIFGPDDNPFDGGTITDIFGDIFGDLFAGRRRKQPTAGRDIRFNLEVSFEEAATGSSQTIRVPRKVRCEPCAGSGARSGSAPSRCDTCTGSGQVSMKQGFFNLNRECSYCRGKGTVVRDPCGKCLGSGAVDKEEVLVIRIPAGADDGQVLRAAGKGEVGAEGGPPGDLKIALSVRDHLVFEREGKDLLCIVPISFTQATLGARVDVPTLDKPVRMKVPAGTQSGRVFRLRDRGIKPPGGEPVGDLLVTVMVETPDSVDDGTAELLRDLDRRTAKATPKRAEFRDRVKSLRKKSR